MAVVQVGVLKYVVQALNFSRRNWELKVREEGRDFFSNLRSCAESVAFGVCVCVCMCMLKLVFSVAFCVGITQFNSGFLFSSVLSLSHVRLFATPWIAAHQVSLTITNFRSSLRFMSIESVMPSSYLILFHPLLLLPPICPSIKVFSNESTLHMRWQLIHL